MKKFKSLLKAILSQDMNVFVTKISNSSKIKNVSLILFLSLMVMYSIGIYCYLFAKELSKLNLTYITLTFFIFTITILTFLQGIYKSQGILFECKDNDLLFSLPIKKSNIFALRIIKLLLFQLIYNLLYIIPVYAVYIFFERPSFYFYLISLLMLLLLPIIPTVIACFFGYLIKAISSKFKSKKLMQVVLSTILFLGIFYLSFSSQDFILKIVENATSINDVITKIYYPMGLYIKLIQKFNIIDFLNLIAINILFLVLFIYIGSIFYFKITSKLSEESTQNIKRKSKFKLKVSTPFVALIKKELNRYFSSYIYMFNTSFGFIIMFVFVIGLCINSDGVLNTVINGNGFVNDLNIVYEYLPKIYLQLVIFTGFMTSITASSISLEGKSFNVTKSLPAKIENILLSKILTSNLISQPIMLLSNLIFFIKFSISLQDMFFITTFTLVIPTLNALLGLIINLKYPKMNALNDTEVVKQSMSSAISIFAGLLLFIITTVIMTKLYDNINFYLTIELCIFVLFTFILWNVLKRYGKKRFIEINV